MNVNSLRMLLPALVGIDDGESLVFIEPTAGRAFYAGGAEVPKQMVTAILGIVSEQRRAAPAVPDFQEIINRRAAAVRGVRDAKHADFRGPDGAPGQSSATAATPPGVG